MQLFFKMLFINLVLLVSCEAPPNTEVNDGCVPIQVYPSDNGVYVYEDLVSWHLKLYTDLNDINGERNEGESVINEIRTHSFSKDTIVRVASYDKFGNLMSRQGYYLNDYEYRYYFNNEHHIDSLVVYVNCQMHASYHMVYDSKDRIGRIINKWDTGTDTSIVHYAINGDIEGVSENPSRSTCGFGSTDSLDNEGNILSLTTTRVDGEMVWEYVPYIDTSVYRMDSIFDVENRLIEIQHFRDSELYRKEEFKYY